MTDFASAGFVPIQNLTLSFLLIHCLISSTQGIQLFHWRHTGIRRAITLNIQAIEITGNEKQGNQLLLEHGEKGSYLEERNTNRGNVWLLVNALQKRDKCQRQSYSGLSCLLHGLELGKARRHMLIVQRESHAKAGMRHCYQTALTAKTFKHTILWALAWKFLFFQ